MADIVIGLGAVVVFSLFAVYFILTLNKAAKEIIEEVERALNVARYTEPGGWLSVEDMARKIKIPDSAPLSVGELSDILNYIINKKRKEKFETIIVITLPLSKISEGKFSCLTLVRLKKE